MRHFTALVAALAVVLVVVLMCGCGGNGESGARVDSTAKPVKPPPDDPGGMMDPAIVFSRSGVLCVIRDDGSGLSVISSPLKEEDYDPAWSPDGSMIAFIRRDNVECEPYPKLCIIAVTGNAASGYTFSAPRVVYEASPAEGVYPMHDATWMGNDTIVFSDSTSHLFALHLVPGPDGPVAAGIQSLDRPWELSLQDTVDGHPRWIYIGAPSVAPRASGGYLLAYNAVDTADYESGANICLVEVDNVGGAVVRTDGRTAGPSAVLRRFGAQSQAVLSRDGEMLAFNETGDNVPPGFELLEGVDTLPVSIVESSWDYPELSQDGINRVYSEYSAGHTCTWSPSRDRIALNIANGIRKGGGVNYDLVCMPSGGAYTFLTTDTKYCEWEADWRWQ